MSVMDVNAVVDGNGSSPNAPLVSVLILAYNNAPYVFDAIRGVLSQRCAHPVEILIGEDCSTDNTRDEIRRAIAGSEHRVTVFFREENVGMHRNYDDLLRRARGRYVADLDGDDVWTDPDKLASQVAILEAREDVSLVFTRAITVDANGRAIDGSSDYMALRDSLEFWQVFSRASIPHSTIVFRRSLLSSLPQFTFRLPNYDWSMFVALASKGKILGLSSVTCNYTWHGFGSASSRSPFRHARANWLQYMAHAKHFRDFLSEPACTQARDYFGNNVGFALQTQCSVREFLSLNFMYFSLCVTLRAAPRYRWLAGEAVGWLRASLSRFSSGR